MSATEGLANVQTLATHTALTVWGVASDFLIVIILFALFFLFAYYVGRGPFVALLLALYAAYALYVVFPYKSYLPSAPALTALVSQMGVYLGLTVLFYVILRRVVVSDFLYIGLFGIIALSFFAAAFLLTLAFNVFPVSSVYHFTPVVTTLFAHTQYFFWWFVAPAVGLLFLAR